MYSNSLSHQEKTNFINVGIYQRNIPSAPLQPYLDIQPVSTRFQLMPVFNTRTTTPTTFFEKKANYNPSVVFAPITKPPPNRANYVSIESELRNQYRKNHKDDRTAFIPSSNSDMYYYAFSKYKTNINGDIDSSTETITMENWNKKIIPPYYSSTTLEGFTTPSKHSSMNFENTHKLFNNHTRNETEMR